MNILFIAPRVPLPANSGGKIRTFNLLKNIALFHDVTLVSFSFDKDENYVHDLEELGITVYCCKAREFINPLYIFSHKPANLCKYYKCSMKKLIKNVVSLQKFDIVHFDHLLMAQYIDCIGDIPCVIDEHNVEFLILKRCFETEANLFKKALFYNQYKKMQYMEKEYVGKCSAVLTVSEEDKKYLVPYVKVAEKINVVPNGVDTEYFNPNNISVSYPVQNNSIVFTGSMDWLPNDDAIIYFIRDVWPFISKVKPDAKFYVVGRNPSQRLRLLANKDHNIIVTGTVNDVRPYIAQASVYIVPLRIGGGTRLKILEAMSMAKVIVSTKIGAEGIACTNGKDIIIQDNPQEFAGSVIDLMEDANKRNILGKNAKDLAHNVYDWHSIAQKLVGTYSSVCSTIFNN